MRPPYIFHPNVVVRTPRLPFTTGVSTEKIDALLQDDIFLESIYLASPVLYAECIKYRDGIMKDTKDIRKLKKTLTKYYLRSVSRCTPFGLFSGCGVAEWKDDAGTLTVSNATKRHTRFDMHYLCALAQHLAKQTGIKEHLVYYTNNSFYTIGDEIRYVEYKYLSGRRIHQISAVNAIDYLEQILTEAATGITITRLEEILSSPDISSDEITMFIDELLGAQLLVSELEPAITGDEFIHQILTVLKRIFTETGNDGVLEIIEILETANNKLTRIDGAEHNTAAAYKEIMTLLDRLEVVYDESKLFQTDLVLNTADGGVPMHLQEQLLKAVEVMNRFGAYYNNNANIESFIRRFSDRYEEKEIPLLEVLDTETGIGYLEAVGEEHVPLVEDIVLPHAPNPVQNYKWSPVEKYLVNKVTEAYNQNKSVVEIQEEEMRFLVNDNWNDLPPSMHLMFRITGQNNELLYIENCGSSSAVNLLGRFAHADPRILALAKDIAAKEEALNPDVVFAEVIHLPESRIGNVLLHPAFRKYEIPYLSKSSLPAEQQVQVQDLLVSVKRGAITLRSSKTGKVIMPRLSNAHNFQHNALPVYQFLCDLQTSQLRNGVGFHWGSITYHYKFLPRVQYRNVVLSPATWKLIRSDFDMLFTATETETDNQLLTRLRNKFNIPQLVVLADGDNELFIDFDNEVSASLFIETIKKRAGFELKEFLGTGKIVCNQQHEYFNNQLLASLIKTTPTYKTPAPLNKERAVIHNSFIPGSEWLYYKIYCGAKSADKILTDAIRPITEMLLQKNIISRFFFIRYNDPGFHIRLRLQLNNGADMGTALQTIYTYLQPFHHTGHIWKLQTDTYNREAERYGGNSVAIAEDIFYHDSAAVLMMLNETWGDEREHIRWLWAMRSIDELLNSFNYTLEQKLALTDVMKQNFAKEFKADKFLKEQLNAKFRIYRQAIEQIMEPANDSRSNMLPLLEALYIKTTNTRPLAQQLLGMSAAGTLQLSIPELLSSYIHMLVNRIITSKPRLHEMVIYDFIYRYYRAVAGKNNIQVKQPVISPAHE